MSNQINPLPDDPETARRLIEAQAANTKMILERGVIGKVFGSRDHAPFNLAAMVIVVCLVTASWMLAFAGGYTANKDALTFLGGFITLALGYVFGKSDKV